MTNARIQYEKWMNDPSLDDASKQELAAIADQNHEIEDRFYMHLQFGTAGLRGVLGAGTNRMNRYTVARAATGFARYLAAQGDEICRRGLAISYDSRRYSDQFALQTALIFCGHGIRVYLSDQLRPVPMLSFAIRHFQTAAGVMITASHNPAQYNGFKAYGEDGGQLPPEAADAVSSEMAAIDNPIQLTWPSEKTAREKGLLIDIGQDLDDAYNTMLLELSVNRNAAASQADMRIIYTPLHGAGYRPVMRVLESSGFHEVHVVKEQALPDPDFSTVKSPNPEERSALKMAIDLAGQQNAELVIATDPDGDRTGLAVRSRDGSYEVLSGNQIGLLLMDYILSAHQKAGTMPEKPFVVTTIVSTKLTRKIAASYGVKLYECLTGFKFIAELIKLHDEQGDQHYLFGFEESFGFLAGTDVRDKDAVVTSMLIAEMAAAARAQGLTLYDQLQDLYRRFGYAAELTLSIARGGKTGLEKIAAGMDTLRRQKKDGFAGLPVTAVCDYLTRERFSLETGESEVIDLPESNVLLYEMAGLDWLCVRPSGTEPKIKIYFGIYRERPDDARQVLNRIRDQVEAALEHII